MRTYARHALRTPRPRTTRPLSQPQPGLRKGDGVQVGPQCPSGRIYGVCGGAAGGEESRGIALVYVGRRGVATVRRYVVRASYIVRSFGRGVLLSDRCAEGSQLP